MMSIVSFDRDWQYPAITEQHAFHKIREFFSASPHVVYIAFPWATLIDLLDRGKHQEAEPFLAFLRESKANAEKFQRRITVCQHINLIKHLALLQEIGVTDVFWSHATVEHTKTAAAQNINIHAFPLYPVQAVGLQNEGSHHQRDVLYSFVGAKANPGYLTEARNHIIELLSGDDNKGGIVIARQAWHYEKVVYDHQVNKRIDQNDPLVDEAASAEFSDIVTRSIFSLCPSGSGPNTIRLWESIGLGAIPVVLSEQFLPPGDPALWQEAVVYCAETPEAIKRLPDELARMAKDETLLARKRHALKQLWQRYGPDCFVYDVIKLIVLHEAKSDTATPVSKPRVFRNRVASLIEAKAQDALLCVTITSYLLANERDVKAELANNPVLMKLIETLAANPSEPAAKLLRTVCMNTGVITA